MGQNLNALPITVRGQNSEILINRIELFCMDLYYRNLREIFIFCQYDG